ncbi:MAG TPA: cyclic nucleotide-binding domain-containing protein [Cyclobacteriaceae bacterium]|nr:cyclic nucleotide-binding domain-containing protein [Cyclobacteriaceae bacterium]
MEKAYTQLKKYLKDNTSLSEDDLEKVASLFKYKKVKRNTMLEKEGQVCKHFYFVAKGCLRLYEIDKKGKEVIGKFALEDSIISAITSFITQKKSLDFLSAHEPSELLIINRDDFYKACQTFPEFSILYHKFMEFAFIHSQMRVYIFLGMEGIDRLKWVLEHEPNLLTRISSKSVASYLGMTNSTLSRLKAKL